MTRCDRGGDVDILPSVWEADGRRARQHLRSLSGEHSRRGFGKTKKDRQERPQRGWEATRTPRTGDSKGGRTPQTPTDASRGGGREKTSSFQEHGGISGILEGEEVGLYLKLIFQVDDVTLGKPHGLEKAHQIPVLPFNQGIDIFYPIFFELFHDGFK